MNSNLLALALYAGLGILLLLLIQKRNTYRCTICGKKISDQPHIFWDKQTNITHKECYNTYTKMINKIEKNRLASNRPIDKQIPEKHLNTNNIKLIPNRRGFDINLRPDELARIDDETLRNIVINHLRGEKI